MGIFMDWPNRTACGVLDEMRHCYKTRNFAYIMGLIEELQSICNRMEANIENKNDAERYRKDRSRLRKEVRLLEAQVEDLTASIDDIKDKGE